MDPESTREIHEHLGPERRGRSEAPTATEELLDAFARLRAGSLCVASGKGGTGKSVVTAALAVGLARQARTLLVDADFGVGNAHILQDVHPELSFLDVVEGQREVRDVRVPCGPRLDLVPGGSGVSRMASLAPFELHLVACGLEAIEIEYGYVLVDSAAGISSQTLAFAAASDVVLVVTTPDVTALTDAYAFLKVLLQRRGDVVPLFLVNRARDQEEARHVAERYVSAARKFLGREPRWIGWLPEDRAVVDSVNARQPVVLTHPHCPFARALERITAVVAAELERVPHRGLGRTLVRRVGWTPGLGGLNGSA
jgi:flagellar biosynthesis protein FlhG